MAKATGIDDLRLTTRDISDYDELMQHRLRVMAEYGVSLSQIQAVIAEMGPLPGLQSSSTGCGDASRW